MFDFPAGSITCVSWYLLCICRRRPAAARIQSSRHNGISVLATSPASRDSVTSVSRGPAAHLVQPHHQCHECHS